MRLSDMAGYGVGFAILLISLLFLLISILGGAILMIAGLFAFPVVRRKISSKTNLDITRTVSVGGVVVLFIIGFGVVLASVPGDTPPIDSSQSEPNEIQSSNTDTPTPSPANVIRKPASAMLPTIDDFDAGWIDATDKDWGDNATAYFNLDTDTYVKFDVVVLRSEGSASDAYEERKRSVRERGLSSESVDVGDDGFLYKLDRRYIIVNFRVVNVLGRVEFDGPNVLTPETNAVRFADDLRDTIVE